MQLLVTGDDAEEGDDGYLGAPANRRTPCQGAGGVQVPPTGRKEAGGGGLTLSCSSTPGCLASPAPQATAATRSACRCPLGLLTRGTGAGGRSSLTSPQRIQDSPTKGVRVPTDLQVVEIHISLKEVEIHMGVKEVEIHMGLKGVDIHMGLEVQEIHMDPWVGWIHMEAGLQTLTELRGGRSHTDLKQEEVRTRKDKVCIN